MMAFLAVASGAVWGQTGSGTEDDPWTIIITGITKSSWTNEKNVNGDNYSVNKGTDNNNVVTIKKDGFFLIKDEGVDAKDKSNVQIKFAEGVSSVGITLEGVKTNAYLDNDLTASEEFNPDLKVYSDRCAMEIPSGVTVTLNWIGNNKLWSGGNCAGINVEPGATLILAGPTTGSLEAGSFNNSDNTHAYGAGIGGDYNNPNFGDIIIKSGIINAYSQVQSEAENSEAYGAGIGGGYNGTFGSTSGSILITGGTVNAYCENRSEKQGLGAGIGGGNNGTCDNITILGGTVTAASDDATDIGANGTVSKHPEIIIGKWDETTSTSVTAESKDKTNFLDASGSSYDAGTGTVKLPEGTQMCLISGLDPTNLGAYKVSYKHADGITSSSTLSVPMAYGPNTSYKVAENSPSAEETVDGIKYQSVTGLWLNFSNAWIDASSTQTTGGNTNLSSLETITYSDAWVLKEHTVFYTTTAGLSAAFDIYYPDVNELFTIKYKDEVDYTSLEDAGLEQNGNTISKDADGDCLLIGRDEAYKLGLTFTPKGKLTSLEGTVNINIEDKLVDVATLTITATSNNSVYDGTNQWNPNNSGKITIDINNGNNDLPLTPFDISFSTDYSSENADAATWTAQPKDADEYYVKIAVKDGYEQSYTGKQVLTTPVIIAQRPMDINLAFNKTSITEDEELTWDDDVNINIEEFDPVNNRGLVTNEDIQIKGSIDYVIEEDGTATVTITDIVIGDSKTFKLSNYSIYINGSENAYRVDDGTEIVEEDVPVNPSSTGGGTTDKRYQLYLANKDYLDNGKTEEFYDKLGLELFSRHNKKYEKAGGSFTIWYEKDGVANDGNYRIFWSNRANGEYKEVKFDPVSEYFRIDNVHSDVYVKIYDADGFPVANEAITAQDFRAYAQPNKIIVITPEPTDVQIISMAGAVVAADKVTGQREFANLAEGVYIVRMGETIVKLQVRN